MSRNRFEGWITRFEGDGEILQFWESDNGSIRGRADILALFPDCREGGFCDSAQSGPMCQSNSDESSIKMDARSQMVFTALCADSILCFFIRS